jgi:hypothetical protein
LNLSDNLIFNKISCCNKIYCHMVRLHWISTKHFIKWKSNSIVSEICFLFRLWLLHKLFNWFEFVFLYYFLYPIYKCMIFLVTHCKLAHNDFIFQYRKWPNQYKVWRDKEQTCDAVIYATKHKIKIQQKYLLHLYTLWNRRWKHIVGA